MYLYNISGGPSPQYLQYVNVPLIPNSECNSLSGYKAKGFTLSNSQLCAGNLTSGGIDSCSGDSGGALACDAGGFVGHVLTGVVSFGYKCGEPNFPGIYSKVTHYIDWIISKMGDSATTTTTTTSDSKYSKSLNIGNSTIEILAIPEFF